MPTSDSFGQRELDAAAHGVYALCADTYAVAVLPNELPRFCATASSGAAFALVAAGHCYDRMIAFAIDAARVRRRFQRVDRQQSFDEDVEQFHEAPEFLH